MSNRDKIQKLEELNTALDKRVDPLLDRLRDSPYTPIVLIAVIALVVALTVWAMG